MTRSPFRAAGATALVAAALASAQSQPADPIARLRAAGLGTQVALHPIRVLGQASRQVRDALGLVLERKGMTSLVAADEAFTPAKDAEWPAVAEQFAAFVKATPGTAGHALYAEYLGDPRTGPTEVRWVLAARDGAMVFADRQTPKDPDFKRTAARDPDPLGCSQLVAVRLLTLAGWHENPTEDGPFTRRWAEASGIPAAAEQKAIAARLDQLKEALETTCLTVHATRVGATQEAASATRLAAALKSRLGCGTAVADTSAQVTVAPTPNQQKHLWDLARGFSTFVKAHPPTAGYAVLVDVIGDPTQGHIRGVQVVVCDRAGAVVLTDFQNDQWPDYQRIKPRSLEDCERLAVDRLAARLR